MNLQLDKTEEEALLAVFGRKDNSAAAVAVLSP
jgi:hypothetical protein